MLSNFSSINIENKKYSSENEIDIYKDTVKAMLKIKKDINQLNQNNIENDSIILQDQITINNLKDSFEESLLLLDLMKKELEKNILKKYNIENINSTKNINKVNNNNINIINNNKDLQNYFIKKNFK